MAWTGTTLDWIISQIILENVALIEEELGYSYEGVTTDPETGDTVYYITPDALNSSIILGIMDLFGITAEDIYNGNEPDDPDGPLPWITSGIRADTIFNIEILISIWKETGIPISSILNVLFDSAINVEHISTVKIDKTLTMDYLGKLFSNTIANISYLNRKAIAKALNIELGFTAFSIEKTMPIFWVAETNTNKDIPIEYKKEWENIVTQQVMPIANLESKTGQTNLDIDYLRTPHLVSIEQPIVIDWLQNNPIISNLDAVIDYLKTDANNSDINIDWVETPVYPIKANFILSFEKLTNKYTVKKINVEHWATLKEIVANYILNLSWANGYKIVDTLTLEQTVSVALNKVINLVTTRDLSINKTVVLDTLLATIKNIEVPTETLVKTNKENIISIDNIQNILSFLRQNIEYQQLSPILYSNATVFNKKLTPRYNRREKLQLNPSVQYDIKSPLLNKCVGFWDFNEINISGVINKINYRDGSFDDTNGVIPNDSPYWNYIHNTPYLMGEGDSYYGFGGNNYVDFNTDNFNYFSTNFTIMAEFINHDIFSTPGLTPSGIGAVALWTSPILCTNTLFLGLGIDSEDDSTYDERTGAHACPVFETYSHNITTNIYTLSYRAVGTTPYYSCGRGQPTPHILMVVYNGGNSIEMYVDGIKQSITETNTFNINVLKNV
jgi:hypothetical protein